MYTIERHVGRLVEVRHIAPSPMSLEEVMGFREALVRFIRAANEPLVICADLRQATVYAPAAAEQVAAMMKLINTKLERSAIVLPTDRATFSLQVERLVRAAGLPTRRTFRLAPVAAEWLGEVLGEEEKKRLGVFLEI